jgi:hypothetical protein
VKNSPGSKNNPVILQGKFTGPETNAPPGSIRRGVERNSNGIPERIEGTEGKDNHKADIQGVKNTAFNP